MAAAPALIILEQVPYESTRHFTPETIVYQLRDGSEPGIPLSLARNDEILRTLNGYNQPMISQMPVPVKSSIRVQPVGQCVVGVQKNVRRRHAGRFISVTRAKSVQLVAEVVAEFIQKAQAQEVQPGPYHFGHDGIQLEHLVLLELRRVSPGSFQPVLAIRPQHL